MESGIMDYSTGVAQEVGIQADSSCYPLQSQSEQMNENESID